MNIPPIHLDYSSSGGFYTYFPAPAHASPPGAIVENSEAESKATAIAEPPKPSVIKPLKTILYKTQWCINIVTIGVCRYGIKCIFVHHFEEIRPVTLPRNYKTSRCNKQDRLGGCPYQFKCAFRHDSDNPPGTLQVLIEKTPLRAMKK